MDASGLLSFVYSINFQIMQIPATNHHFSCEKNLLLCGSMFLKKTFFLVWYLVTKGKKIEKIYFVTKKNTPKLWRTWSLALLVHNIRCPFFKKVPFLANMERCPKFLEYSLTRGICRKSHPWYWFYRWSSSSAFPFSCKITFVGAGNLQMITSKFWFEYSWVPYVLFFDPVLCIALVWSIWS